MNTEIIFPLLSTVFLNHIMLCISKYIHVLICNLNVLSGNVILSVYHPKSNSKTMENKNSGSES